MVASIDVEVPDRVASLDRLSALYGDAVSCQVAIDGVKRLAVDVMGEDNPVAIIIRRTGRDDPATISREDRLADGFRFRAGGEGNALVVRVVGRTETLDDFVGRGRRKRPAFVADGTFLVAGRT